MQTYSLIIWMLLFSAICTAALAAYGRRFIPRIGAALPYTLLMTAASGFACMNTLELLSRTLELKILFHNLRFLFLPYIAILELWLILEYVKRAEWFRRRWTLSLIVIPVTATLLALTSPWHTLFRYNFSLITIGPVPVLEYSESAFFHLYSGFSLAILIICYFILFNESRKTQTLLEKQTLLLFAALLIPSIITYLFALGITPVQGVNLTAPLFWISAFLFTIALFRYRFLDIIPIARSHLIDRMSQLMLVLDREGFIIDSNPAASEFFRLKTRKKGTSHIDDVARDWPELLSLCWGELGSKPEIRRESDGKVQYFTALVDILTNASGTPEGRLIILQDVTSQREAEITLFEVNELYKRTINAINDGIWDWDLRTGKVFLSPIFYTMLGYEPGDFSPSFESFLALIHPEERDDVEAEIRDRINTGDAYALEFRAQKKEGGYTWIQSRGMVVEWDMERRPVRVVGTHTDISTRKQSEEALRLANKKLQLLSSITRHDIVNQITVIHMYLELADALSTDPVLSRHIRTVHESAEMIEKQIEFTREYEQIGVREPVWLSICEQAGRLTHESITVTCDCSGYFIYCDPMIAKVFENLMDNTIRHAEGATVVRISCISVSTGLLITWEDDGPGILEGEKEKIFMSGFGKNTGLGLFMIREILGITGIAITETGTYGEGARFEIKVPHEWFRKESRAGTRSS